MTDTITVRAVEGRIARTGPRGSFIPSDAFVQVSATPYVLRLLEFHGDIELPPEEKPVAEVQTAAAKQDAPAKKEA